MREWSNNSFKPNPLRYTNNMAGKACHVVGYATQVGLTQVLGHMDRRKEFLAEFLTALGAQEIEQLKTTPTFISGTVVYDPSDPDEQQDFSWTVTPDEAPSPAATRLMHLIRVDRLLHSDKLLSSSGELAARFNAGQRSRCSPGEFEEALQEILNVRVGMLDEGVEGDFFFIHR